MDPLKRIFKTGLFFVVLLSSLFMVSRPCMAMPVEDFARIAQALAQFIKSTATSIAVLDTAITINGFVKGIQHNVLGGINSNSDLNTGLQATQPVNQTQDYNQYTTSSSAHTQLNNSDTFGVQLSSYKQPSTIKTSDKYGPQGSQKGIGSYSTTNINTLRVNTIHTNDSKKAAEQVAAKMNNQAVGITQPSPAAVATPSTIKLKAMSDTAKVHQSVTGNHINDIYTQHTAINAGGKTTSVAQNIQDTKGVTNAATQNTASNKTVGSKVAAFMTAGLGSFNALHKISERVGKLNDTAASQNAQLVNSSEPVLQGLKNQSNYEQPGAQTNVTGK